VLLTLLGWTSRRFAEAFGVREDTARQWRSEFARGGVATLQSSPPPGPLPRSRRKRRYALLRPCSKRPSPTALMRLIGEIEGTRPIAAALRVFC
jgi:hypothetical protein